MKKIDKNRSSFINHLLFIIVALMCLSTIVNSQTITTPYTGSFTFFAAPANIAFVIDNTNGAAIILNDIGHYMETAENNSVWELYYSTTSLSGSSTVPGASWTLLATSNIIPVSTNGITTAFSGLGYSIPASTQIRFVMRNTGPGSTRYVLTPSPAGDIFSSGGVNLKVGTQQIGGFNVGYSGNGTTLATTPRYWHGSITFAPSGPCTSPPTPGISTASPSSGACVGSNISLGLSGATGGSGQTYQWQTSPTIGGLYTNLGSSQLSPSLITPSTTTLYYRCEVTCSGNSQNSTPVLVTVNPSFPGGTYTINSGAATGGTNFQTFNDFNTALSCGIAGAVVVNVVPGSGPYNEQVEFVAVGGSSVANTITINGNNNLLTFNGISTLPYTLGLNGADYFIFNSLNVSGTNATYSLTVKLWNGSDNNTFSNCTFESSTSATGTIHSPFSISGTAISATATGNSGSNNLISGCTTIGGYYGIVITGSISGTGNQVLNNSVTEFYTYGIYQAYCQNTLIKGNTIERPTRTNPSSGYGVFLTTSTASCLVDGNTVRNLFGGLPTSSSAAYCLYNSVSATAGNENVWTNNLVYNINNRGGTIYGIYIPSYNYVKFYHNTIILDDASATGGTTYAAYCNGTGAEVKNNIIYVTRAGSGTKYCMYHSGTTGTSDYNVLYMNAPAGTNNIGYRTTAYATLAAFQSGTGLDLNSVDVDPLFTSFIPTNGLVNDIGTPLGVLTDIVNTPRSLTSPDPGAYEFSLSGLDAAITWVSPTSPAVAGTYPITVNINNTQAQTITSLNLSYNDGSGPITQSFTGLNIPGGSNQNFVFTTQYNLTGNVTITVDILSVNGGSDVISANNTDSYSLCISLSGTYTINAALPTNGTNFQSFNDAITALACGISNPLVFNVVSSSGPYNEQVVIPTISGASFSNTITINGNGNTLTFAGSSANPNTLALNGADYFIFNNLIVDATDLTYAIAGHLYGGADNNTFNNCTFQSSVTGTTTVLAAFALNGSATAASASGNSGNNNLLNGCTMIGGYYSTIFYGSTTIPYNVDNKIINCTARDFYSYGLYNLYCRNTIISGNIVERPNRTNSGTAYCIYLSTSSYNCTVEKNRVRNIFDGQPTSTSTAYCLYNGASGASGFENKWINNLASDMSSSGALYGFYSLGYTYVNFYHNTISFDHTAAVTSSVTYGIYAYGSTTDIKNNNVSITRGGAGTKYCIYMSATGTATSNNNNLYINAAAGNNNVGYFSGAFSTLAAWQGANGGIWDQQSVSDDPIYVLPAAGNYSPSNISLDNIGSPLGVTQDITNSTRSLVDPDPGAYEFSVSPKDVGVYALITPANGECYSNAETITLEIKNYGSTALNFSVDPVTVTCNVSGAVTTTLTGSPTGTLSIGATMNVVMSSTLNMTTSGTYTFNAFTTMASDGNATNNAMLPDSRLGVPIAGTVNSSIAVVCVSGIPTLTVSETSGGAIQWQQSSVSTSGPWVNVGTGGNTYTPASFTQTMYYQALTVCNANSVASNVVTVTLSNPQITGTTPDSRCGIGSVTLGAISSGQGVISWFDTPTGGTALGTGGSFTTNIFGTTTFYAEENIGGGGGSGSAIQVTEIDLGTNDRLEIQNVSPDLVDVTGWKVAIGNSYTDITSVNADIQTLSGTMAPGQIMTWTDLAAGPNYWGSNILWNPGAFPTYSGWAAILDQNNILKDVVFLNWPSANIQGASITIGSTTITVGTQWSGNGIDQTSVLGTESISRQGTSDNNDLTDFSIINLSLDATNPGMTIPFTGFGCASTRVPVVATSTPAPSLNVVANDVTLCPGGTTTVSVSSSNDPNYTYSWMSIPGSFTATGTGPHNVSPSITTKYFVTATDNSAGPNSGCAIIDSVEIFTGLTLSAGTITVSENNFCVSGVPTLSVAGADGGQIQWQRSTISATGPWTNVGTPSTVYTPGTVTQTTYYQVRVSCQSNQVFSNVETVTVANPTLSNTAGATRCGPGQVTLTATPLTGSVNWYAAINDVNSIATGTLYSPIVTGSTTYYAAATDGGANGSLGLPNNVGSTTNSGYSDVGLMFDALQIFTLNSVAIYPVATTPSGDVTVTIALKNSSGTVLESTTVSVPTSVSPGIKTVVNLNFTVPVGTGHRLVFNSATGGGITGFIRELTSGFTYPYTLPGTASITSAYTGGASSAYYYYFYDWQVSTGCEGTRVAVPVTVTPSTGITASATYLTPCAGNPTDLSVTSTNLDYVYTWTSSPAGFNQTGSGPFTVTPGVTTTYTVLANDPNTNCGSLSSLLITPTANSLTVNGTATPSAVCIGSDVQLNADGNLNTGIQYSMSALTGQTYTTLSGGGINVINTNAGLSTSMTNNQDDGAVLISLPFTFNFNGTSFTQMTMCTNGWIGAGDQLAVTAIEGRAGANMFIPTNPNNIIAAWFKDIGANFPLGTGSMRHGLISTDVYAFQWDNAVGSGFTDGATIVISFQINIHGPLSATPGRVDIIYGPTAGTIAVTSAIGLENATSGTNNYLNAVTNNGTTTTLSSAWPGNGNGYRFTPLPSPAFSYSWSPGSNLSATNISNPVAQSLTSPITYTVTMTDGGSGCTKSATVPITVNPLPQPTASSNSPVCAGQSASFFGNNTASGQTTGNSYLWTGPNGFNDIVQNPILSNATAAASGTYTVTVTNQAGCTQTTTTTVTVAPLPALNILSQTNVSCNGGFSGEFTIQVTNGSGFYLYDQNGNINFDGNFTGFSAGTYIVQVTDGNSCASSIPVTITQPDPTTIPDAGQDQTLCAGTTVTLAGNVAAVGTGTWTVVTGSGTFANANDPLTTVTGVGAGLNTYAWTIDNGLCFISNADNVNVTTNAVPTATVSGATSICNGQSANLTLDFTGTGPWTYSYSNGSMTFGPFTTSNNPEIVQVSPTSATTYSLVTLDDTNCSGTVSGSALITVVNNPPIGSIQTFTGPTTACFGNIATITTNAVLGATSYTWSGPSGTLFDGQPGPYSTATNSVSVEFGILGTTSGYSICATAVNACGQSNTRCFWIRGTVSTPAPIAGSTVGCANTTGPYSTSAVVGAANYFWTASPQMQVIAGQGTQNVTIRFLASFTSGTICVAAVTSCGSTSTARCMTVNRATASPGYMNGPFAQCPGQTGQVFSIDPVVGAASYAWTLPSNTTLTSGQGTPSITLSVGSTFSVGNICVTATSICGIVSAPRCKTISSVQPNTPSNITGPNSGVCGQSITYSVLSQAGVTNYNWVVPAGATLIGGAGTNTVQVAFASNFTTGQLCVTAENGCGSSIARCVNIKGVPADLSVISGPNPVCSFDAGALYFINPAFGATSYVWTVPAGATIVAGQGTNAIIVDYGLGGGLITVKAVNACGQSGTRTLNVIVNCRMAGSLPNATLNAYPNPVSSELTIDLDAVASGSYSVELLDLSGRIVKSEVMNAIIGLNRNSMDVSTFAKGMYMLNVKNEEGFSQQLRIAVE